MSRRSPLKQASPLELNSRRTSAEGPSNLLTPTRNRRSVGSLDRSITIIEDASEQYNEYQGRPRSPSPFPPPLPRQPAALSGTNDASLEDEQFIDHSKPIFEMNSESGGTYLQLTFNCPPGQRAPFVVRLDLGSLLGIANAQASSVLGSGQTPFQRYTTAAGVPKTSQRLGQHLLSTSGKGFHSLPPELRNRVYRLLFVRQAVRFQFGGDNSRSSSFLRCSRQIYQEGRSVLYSANKFIFDRCSDRIGHYYDKYRPEVGYSDVEQFIRDIGQFNLSLIKEVNFNLTDADPKEIPELGVEPRRFVNNAALQRVLVLFGKYGKLDNLKIDFAGKRMVTKADKEFLEALTTVMAKEVKLVSKIDCKLEMEITYYMVFPGPSEPWIPSWNKPWESKYGRGSR
ncbi:MAG: hypothetical protein M1830_001351 [Pleopsidium flavum]|nr:MAG: hypothetical protein M1830_001351 [Pleopsidium flavum]